MKQKNFVKELIAMIAIILQATMGYAQWQLGTAPGIKYERPNPNTIYSVGIGAFPNGSPPFSALDINTNPPFLSFPYYFQPGEVFQTTSTANNGINAWRMFTGSQNRQGTEQFSIYTNSSLGASANDYNMVLQASQRDMIFNAGGNGSAFERMRIVGTARNLFPTTSTTSYTVSPGNVGIGTASPLTKLQIGEDAADNGGYRDWMDVGTFYSYKTDNMYVGFKKNTNPHNEINEAIINWGNNPEAAPFGPDRLLFDFTAHVGGSMTASTKDGLEAERMVTNGNHFFIGLGGDPLHGNPYHTGVDPSNTVEINSSATTLGANNSGLRFTDVNNTVTPQTNPSNGVLSLNSNGDVIWVKGGGNGLGTCSTPTTFPAGSDGAIDLQSQNNFYFLGNHAQNVNNMGMGYPCGYKVPAKLSVVQTGWTTNPYNAIGLYEAGNFWAFGVTNNDLSIGVRGTGTAPATSTAIGVYGSDIYNSLPYVGGHYAGYFDDNVYVNGDIYLTGSVIPSDIILKKDTASFKPGLSVIRKLHTVTYKYNGKAGFSSSKTHTGVIAEQVAQVAPYAIDTLHAKLDSTDTQPTDILAVDNEAVMYTAVNAIQELDSSITPLTTPPPAPTLVFPSNGFNGFSRSIYLRWDTVPGKFVLYHIEISSDSTFQTHVYFNTGVFTTTYKTYFVLKNGLTYYWRVQAFGTGGAGPWSEVRSFSNGSVTALAGLTFSQSTLSDNNLKHDITPLTNALQNVNRLQGVNYKWNTSQYPWLADSSAQIGLIAQDVKQVYPQVVYKGDSGFYHIDYQHLVPALVEAIKTLTKRDSTNAAHETAMQAELDSLKTAMAQCCAANSAARMSNNNASPGADTSGLVRNVKHVVLNSLHDVVLYQNQPNPFGDKTSIHYYVNPGVQEAYMVFTDEMGRVLKKVPITDRGYGSVKVDAAGLNDGIYAYSLVVDGKIMDTKKMVRISTK